MTLTQSYPSVSSRVWSEPVTASVASIPARQAALRSVVARYYRPQMFRYHPASDLRYRKEAVASWRRWWDSVKDARKTPPKDAPAAAEPPGRPAAAAPAPVAPKATSR